MYRCQSAHKLVELDAKFRIFERSRCTTVLDLAAAPGGFAQVALERMAACSSRPPSSPSPMVIGVDLRPIDPLPGLVTVRCNILHHKDVLEHVRKAVGSATERREDRRRVRVVLHDGVSVVQGQRALSVTYSQNQMALSALQLACSVLRDCGDDRTAAHDARAPPSFFVTKIMRSRHLPQVLRAAESCFAAVDVFRPSACKPGSPETYLVMAGLRGTPRAGRTDGSHAAARDTGAAFSLPPFPEDAPPHRAGDVVWFCLGCGRSCVGCRPCPVCAPLRH